MQENISAPYTDLSRLTATLTIESLDIPPSHFLPASIFAILTYCLILFFNCMLLVTIALERNLHKPMYILLFNLPIFDIMGATALYPQLMFNILSQSRSISYPACALQGILIHLYLTGSLLILTAMAYDRYLAISWPLKYNSMMTPSMVKKLIFLVWFLMFTLIGILFGLTLSKEICRTTIVDLFCNNSTIMKLICVDTTASNYFGIFIMSVVQGGSLFVVLLTYIRILITCLTNQHSDCKIKAIQTCGTHLVVFLCFEFNTLFMFVSHRLESASPYLRRAFGFSIIIFPPILNPLIYGLKTKEIRQKMFKFLK